MLSRIEARKLFVEIHAYWEADPNVEIVPAMSELFRRGCALCQMVLRNAGHWAD